MTEGDEALRLESDFRVFWAAYPRKVAKRAAEKAWGRLKPSSILVLVILADVEGRRKSEQWKKSGGQFIPHASTYLNGRRWEDEDVPVSNLSGLAAFARGE
jgi:hypothetical protein